MVYNIGGMGIITKTVFFAWRRERKDKISTTNGEEEKEEGADYWLITGACGYLPSSCNQRAL